MGLLNGGSMVDNNYEFIDYKYYGLEKYDPLTVLIINEQFEIMRKSFYSLDENIQNILNYFIIERNSSNFIDVDIDKYLNELKYIYINLYNGYSD